MPKRKTRKHGIKTVDELDRRKLMTFREQIVNQPKRHNAAGAQRGAKRTSGEARTVSTGNCAPLVPACDT